jgi:[ribosomal protein S5]-alanine N-acetyltransferase
MSDSIQPVLTTERLVLRPFVWEDAAAVQRLAGAREVADTTLNIPHPYEDGMAEQWIESHAAAFAAGRLVSYAVTDQPSGGLLGTVSLHLEPTHARGELGYWFGVPFWGKGYATEAARALVDFGFAHLQLHRIQARHFVRNPASGRVMQKLGMVYEGTLRQDVCKWGRFEDSAIYAVLAEEWRTDKAAEL